MAVAFAGNPTLQFPYRVADILSGAVDAGKRRLY